MPCTDFNCFGCNQIPVLTIHYNLVEKINNFGQQLSEAALASCPEKILCSIALKEQNLSVAFLQPTSGAASKSKSHLSGAASQNNFEEPSG